MNQQQFERAARLSAKAYANALGHRMSPWSRTFDGCECIGCGSVLVASDAQHFVAHSDVSALGSLSAPCLYDHDAERTAMVLARIA